MTPGIPLYFEELGCLCPLNPDFYKQKQYVCFNNGVYNGNCGKSTFSLFPQDLIGTDKLSRL